MLSCLHNGTGIGHVEQGRNHLLEHAVTSCIGLLVWCCPPIAKDWCWARGMRPVNAHLFRTHDGETAESGIFQLLLLSSPIIRSRTHQCSLERPGSASRSVTGRVVNLMRVTWGLLPDDFTVGEKHIAKIASRQNGSFRRELPHGPQVSGNI